MPRIESDSKRTGLVPPTVGRKPRSARRIQRAPTVPIPPQRVAVEARPCAWAGRARSCGGRPGAARLAPSAERRRRAAGRFGLGPVGRAPGRQGPGRGRGGGRQIDQIEVPCRDFGLLLFMIGMSRHQLKACPRPRPRSRSSCTVFGFCYLFVWGYIADLSMVPRLRRGRLAGRALSHPFILRGHNSRLAQLGRGAEDRRKRRGVERLSIPPGAPLRRGGVVGG